MCSNTERTPTFLAARHVFLLLLAGLFVLATGHLYALEGSTTLSLGLPAWVWLQLVVVSVMLVVAWLAIRLVRLTATEVA